MFGTATGGKIKRNSGKKIEGGGFTRNQRDVKYGGNTRKTKRTLVAESIALQERKTLQQRGQRDNQSR